MDPALSSLKMAMVICLLSLSSIMSMAQDFDFFYFVQQWPGSYCETNIGCCYPKSGKPASDFSIHGLWPNYNDGTYPSNCDDSSPFLLSKISDLKDDMEKEWPSLSCPSNDGTSFWSHEWVKHGTCAESVLNQHQYFQAALNLKTQLNLLDILRNAGIQPDGGIYSLRSIKNAIQEATGFTPGIECSFDSSRRPQLYQIFVCVDTSAANFIDCPVLPRGRCASQVEFPAF